MKQHCKRTDKECVCAFPLEWAKPRGFPLADVCVCVNSKMMDVCGEAESRLASELMQYEVQIERDILDPLNTLAEVQNPLWMFVLLFFFSPLKLDISTDWDTQHTKTEEATRQTGPGLRLGQDKVEFHFFSQNAVF